MNSFPRIIIYASALILPWLLGIPSHAQFGAIELGAISRTGAQTDSEFELRVVTGNRIDEIESLRFSDPRITANLITLDPLAFTQQPVPEFGKFRVKVAADTPPGRYEVRAIGRHGVSNPRLFLVSREPDLIPEAISHSRETPTPMPANQWLHAKSTAAEIDYYVVTVDAKEPVQIELLAQQLDSWLIGHLKLFAPDGKLATTARGGDGADPRLDFVATQSGDYVLAVHDFLYRGGNEFPYQVIARTGEPPARDPIDHSNSPQRLHPSSVTLTDNVNAKRIDDSHVVEISPPCQLNSQFDSRDDEDVFEFNASKGQTFVIEVVSQRDGQPTDVRLVVQRADPKSSGELNWLQVLTADDSQNVGGIEMPLRSKDPVATLKVPTDGKYRIVVRDLDTGQSLAERQSYRLSVRNPAPRFDLVAYHAYPHKDANQTRHLGAKLVRGGTEAIRVLAVRHDGWSGDIQLSVKGLPPDVSVSPATMAANQTQAQMTLTANEDAAAWVGPIEVVGTATVGNTPVNVVAQPATIRWGKANSRDFIQSRLCHELVVAVTDKDVAAISIQFADESVPEVKKGASLKLPIKLTRRDGGKAACVLRARDLPAGVTAGDVNVAPDKSEGTLEVKVGAKTAPGTYSLWLQAETKIKVAANPQALKRAQEYRNKLQKLHDAPPASADEMEAVKAAIKVADARIEAAKSQSAKQDLTVYLPSPHTTFRVVEP